MVPGAEKGEEPPAADAQADEPPRHAERSDPVAADRSLPETGQPDLRFFLPPGPPLPPKRWQRDWKTGIRLGSIGVGLALAVVGGVALVMLVGAFFGFLPAHFTASGVAEVDCVTRAKPFVPDIAYGAPVTILDAETGEVYGAAKLDDFLKLKSGVCLLSFSADDVEAAGAYVVRIGASYRVLTSESALRSGAMLT